MTQRGAPRFTAAATASAPRVDTRWEAAIWAIPCQLSDRDDLDAVGPREQSCSQFSSVLRGPGAGEGTARRGCDGLAQAVEVEVGGGRVVVGEQAAALTPWHGEAPTPRSITST